MLALLKSPKFLSNILDKLKDKEESCLTAEEDLKRASGINLTYGDINLYIKNKSLSEFNHGFSSGLRFALDLLEPKKKPRGGDK